MNRKLMLCVSSLALFVMVYGFSASSGIALDYPDKPIRFIVPYPPGGVVDIVARVVGQKLTESFGKQVWVDNQAGASGIIGTEIAAKTAPDGYSILMAYFTVLSIHPSMYRKLPYDPLKDFVHVSLVASTPLILVETSSLQPNTVKELVTLAKSKPGQLNYASAGGKGSGGHLAMELFKSMAGVDIVEVGYKGSGPALTDLLGGHVQLMFDAMTSALPHVRAGRLKGLAVSSAQRSLAAPNIPTVAESGFPGFEFTPWLGVVAPTGTPKEIVAKLNTEIARIMRMADVKERLASLGTEATVSTSEQFTAHIEKEIVKWGKLIKDLDLHAD